MEKILLVVDREVRTIRGEDNNDAFSKDSWKTFVVSLYVFAYRYQFIWHYPLLMVTVGFIVNIKSSFSSMFYYGRDCIIIIIILLVFLMVGEWKAIWILTSRLRLGTAVTPWWCYTNTHWCIVKSKKWSVFVLTWNSYFLNVLEKWLHEKGVYKKHCSCSNFSSVVLL